MSLLGRLWAGIVAAVAGVAVAVGVQIVGQVAVGLPIDYLEKIMLALGTAGFLVGVVVGNRRIGKPKDRSHPEQTPERPQ
jgi:hypothetical protein